LLRRYEIIRRTDADENNRRDNSATKRIKTIHRQLPSAQQQTNTARSDWSLADLCLSLLWSALQQFVSRIRLATAACFLDRLTVLPCRRMRQFIFTRASNLRME
jgi:hypothetical protein